MGRYSYMGSNSDLSDADVVRLYHGVNHRGLGVSNKPTGYSNMFGDIQALRNNAYVRRFGGMKPRSMRPGNLR